VFAGLAASALVNLWIPAPDEGSLPGVALGSQALLVVERTIAFFAAWLMVLAVSAQALAGRLPVEVSGRGVRYADAPTTENMARAMDTAIARIEAEMADYRQEQNELRHMVKHALVRKEDRI
jgi:hypothetical protein